MKESQGVLAAMRRYWEVINRGQAGEADTVISTTDPAVVIGTAPGEGRDGPEAWRQGVRDIVEQLPGVQIEMGPSPRAYELNGVGWLCDEPTWVLPDGARIPTRVTTVWRQDGADWRAVHLHLSVGVPDEMLGQLIGG